MQTDIAAGVLRGTGVGKVTRLCQSRSAQPAVAERKFGTLHAAYASAQQTTSILSIQHSTLGFVVCLYGFAARTGVVRLHSIPKSLTAAVPTTTGLHPVQAYWLWCHKPTAALEVVLLAKTALVKQSAAVTPMVRLQ